MKKINWNEFWINWRNIESEKEEDLFFQVGKTINKMPVSEEVFNEAFEDIVKKLELKKSDSLLEMCCGNGLVSLPLSLLSKKIYAFDFTPHLINSAKKFKQGENIEYLVGDAKSDFFSLFSFEDLPQKFLMNDALAYFTPDDLKLIIENIVNKTPTFLFYLTGIPNNDLKWNFYNTDERKKRYLELEEKKDDFFDGIGRWWKVEEIQKIAQDLNLKCTVQNQNSIISNFRMDVLFER
ncbi:MAG: class I SAM-dependent methyltransferase [Bacteroidota bacterium]